MGRFHTGQSSFELACAAVRLCGTAGPPIPSGNHEAPERNAKGVTLQRRYENGGESGKLLHCDPPGISSDELGRGAISDRRSRDG